MNTFFSCCKVSIRRLAVLFALLYSASMAAGSGGDNGEGRVLLDWSSEVPDTAPAEWVGDVSVGKWGSGEADLRVVDGTTDPASPFEGGKPALYAKTSDQAEAVIWFRPFDSAPMKGWFEFEFMLGEDNLGFGVYTGTPVGGPRFDSSVMGKPLFLLHFRPDQNTSIRIEPHAIEGQDEAEFRTLGPSLNAGSPHTCRMEWDFTENPATVTFLLDGMPITLLDTGGPFEITVDAEAATTGIDTFNLTGAGFFGGASVSEK